MKKFFFTAVMTVLFLSVAFAQDSKKISSAKVKSMKGEVVNTTSFSNDGKPILICFWATWCKPCVEELTALNDIYADLKAKYGLKIIAVSIDDSKTSKRIAPFVKGRGWDYEVYVDENSDFKRAMSVNNPPQSFLLDGSGNIVWQHNGYAPGDEKKVQAELDKLIKK